MASNITTTAAANSNDNTSAALVVYTASKASLRAKIERILADGPSKLKIVTDFDATLSRPTSPSSYAVLEQNSEMSDEYRTTCRALFKHYHQKEISTTLSHAEKCVEMRAWHEAACAALQKERLSRRAYHRALHYAQQAVQLRDGCDALFALTHKLHVPTLVFSAGVGDVIDSVLLHYFSQFYCPSNPYYPIDRLTEAGRAQLLAENARLMDMDKKASASAAARVETDGYAPEEVHQLLSPTTMAHNVTAHNFGLVAGIPRNIYVIANHLQFHSAAAASAASAKRDSSAPKEGDGDADAIAAAPPSAGGHTPTTITAVGVDEYVDTVKRFDPATFSDDDVISGYYNEEAIHVFNKHEAVIKDADYYPSQIRPRPNAVLLGDSLGDALMVAEEEEEGSGDAEEGAKSPATCLRIAFLNTSPPNKTVDSHLAAYLAKFDVVFVDNDGGFGLCAAVMQALADGVTSVGAGGEIDLFLSIASEAAL